MNYFRAHLCEIIWRNHNRGNVLANFLSDVKSLYDVNNQQIKLEFEEDIFGTMEEYDSFEKILNEIVDEFGASNFLEV